MNRVLKCLVSCRDGSNCHVVHLRVQMAIDRDFPHHLSYNRGNLSGTHISYSRRSKLLFRQWPLWNMVSPICDPKPKTLIDLQESQNNSPEELWMNPPMPGGGPC